VAANPGVRAVLVERQRRWVAERGGGVVEGRDIGSVVLPRADIQIYLTASAEERARRRPEEGADALSRRDRLDSTRQASPLEVAEGARVIDTTDRSVGDIVEEVVAWL
jgi:cytidylate kinase